MQTTPQLLSLPKLILVNILSFCNVQDISTFSVLSKRTNQISNDEYLWKSKCIEERIEEMTENDWKTTFKLGLFKWNQKISLLNDYSVEKNGKKLISNKKNTYLISFDKPLNNKFIYKSHSFLYQFFY